MKGKYMQIDAINTYKKCALPIIMTLTEVAVFLRLHRSTISRYATSGELKSHLIGQRRLFKAEDVLAFFDNQVALECVSGKEN
jgi:excisionase family DNA binding protein